MNRQRLSISYDALDGVERLFREEKEPWSDCLSRHLPALDLVRAYDFSWLARDVSGGITVGLVLLSQSLAHAQLSGVHPIRGAYACILAPLAYALLGTSHEGSVGTGGLVALIAGEQLAASYSDEETRSQHVATLSLLVGGLLLAMAALQVSFLVRFLSRPALSGFVSGSALLIVKAMLGPMLSNEGASAVDVLTRAAPPHYPTMCVALAACAWLVAAKPLSALAGDDGRCATVCAALARFKELVALTATSLLVVVWADGVQLVGYIPDGLPAVSLEIPSRARVINMLPGAALVAVVVFVSSFASAKKCALQRGYHVVAARELWALGAANVASAAVGGVPVQIGLSRSALSLSLGVKTVIGSNVVVACVVAAVVGGPAADLVERVPRCALSSVITVSALKLVDADAVAELWERRKLGAGKDLLVWFVAFAVTTACGALKGVAVAVAVSLLLVLHTVATPNLTVLRKPANDADAAWRSSPSLISLPAEGARDALVVRVEGPLWYANAERFHERIEELELAYARRGEAPQAVVLCAQSVSFLDATAISVLDEMVASWRKRNVCFYVASAYGQPKALLEAALGLGDCGRGIDDCLSCQNTLNERRASIRASSSAARRRRGSSVVAPAPKVFVRSLPSFQHLSTDLAGWDESPAGPLHA